MGNTDRCTPGGWALIYGYEDDNLLFSTKFYGTQWNIMLIPRIINMLEDFT